MALLVNAFSTLFYSFKHPFKIIQFWINGSYGIELPIQNYKCSVLPSTNPAQYTRDILKFIFEINCDI
jgi:hypothetical protein